MSTVPRPLRKHRRHPLLALTALSLLAVPSPAPADKPNPERPSQAPGAGIGDPSVSGAPKAAGSVPPAEPAPSARANPAPSLPGEAPAVEASATPRAPLRWDPPAAMDRASHYLVFPLRVHILRSERYLHLNSVQTDADVTRILAKVNQIYAQAGIQFYLESLWREPANDPYTGPPGREAADIVLDTRPRNSLAPGMFHLYFPHDLPVNGSSLQRDGVFVMDRASLRQVPGGIDEPLPRVTAHELAHQFTLGHRTESTALMCPGTTGVLLNEAEIQRARSAAQIIGWGLFPTAALARAQRAPRAEQLGILRCLAALPVPSASRDAAAARLARAERESP